MVLLLSLTKPEELCWRGASSAGHLSQPFFTWVDFLSIHYCTLHNSSLVVAVSSCQRHSVAATCFYSAGFKGMSPGITWLTACNLIIVSSSVLCLVVESVQPRWLSRTEEKIISSSGWSSSMYVCILHHHALTAHGKGFFSNLSYYIS